VNLLSSAFCLPWRQNFLVTGASGELGHSVLRALSEYEPARRMQFFLLMRGSVDLDIERRTKILLELAGVDDQDRFHPIAGDITDSQLISSPEQRNQMLRKLGGILHIAADTSFSKPLESMRIINVGGTQSVLNLSRDAGGIPVGHISSLYAAGGHSGVIAESRLAKAPLYVNAYEQSKWEAEELALDAEVPVCIYRCGLMPGTSAGVVQRLSAFHLLSALYQQDLVGFAPGEPECPIEIISTDDTARAIVGLYFEQFSSGQIFNIAQGDKAPPIDDVAERVQQTFRASYLGIGKRFGKPEFVPQDVFDSLRDSARATKNMRLIRAMALTQSFMPQLLYPKRFINNNVINNIPIDKFTDPLTVVERSVAYCIQTQWLFTLGYNGDSFNKDFGEIDRLVIRYVSQKLLSSCFDGHIHPDLDLSIHLSANHLADIANFVETVTGNELGDATTWASTGVSCRKIGDAMRKTVS
jgi:nucleoside-diphosphate-sugar epimerase